MAGNSGQLGGQGAEAGCPHGEGCACAKVGAKVFAVPSVALAKLKAGQTARVCEACVDPRDAALLRAMGLRPNALIRVCRVGEPCIVEVVAVSDDLWQARQYLLRYREHCQVHEPPELVAMMRESIARMAAQYEQEDTHATHDE